MLQYDFEDSIGYWIFATAHELGRAMNDELAAHGITLRQWEVLALISLTGEQSQSELAERMKIEAPTLVGVLDRMERDGWITRVPDCKDRRRKLIRPTEQVEPAWNRMVECALRTRGRATRNFSAADLETLRELLARMRHNLHEGEETAEISCRVPNVTPGTKSAGSCGNGEPVSSGNEAKTEGADAMPDEIEAGAVIEKD